MMSSSLLNAGMRVGKIICARDFSMAIKEHWEILLVGTVLKPWKSGCNSKKILVSTAGSFWENLHVTKKKYYTFSCFMLLVTLETSRVLGKSYLFC